MAMLKIRDVWLENFIIPYSIVRSNIIVMVYIHVASLIVYCLHDCAYAQVS